MSNIIHNYLSDIIVTQTVDLDAMETDITEHQTLSGVADGSTDLGTFAGSTLTDNITIKAALQEVETALEAVSADGNDTPIVRGDAITGVAPTGGEVASPIAGDTGSVYLTDGTLEKWLHNGTSWALAYTVAAGGGSNLAYTASATDGTVTSDTGTNATIIAGSTTNASLMLPADKTKVDFITVTQAVDLDEMEAESANLVTLSGVASDAVNLGTFTGSTITDNVVIKVAMQELETEVELKAATTDLASNANALGASLIGIEDAGTLITATTVEGALAEIAGNVAVDGTAVLAGKVELATDAETQAGTATGGDGPLVVTPGNMDNMLTTLVGTTSGQYDLDTFTGSTIADDSSVKAALQALETEVETKSSYLTDVSKAATSNNIDLVIEEHTIGTTATAADTVTLPLGGTAADIGKTLEFYNDTGVELALAKQGADSYTGTPSAVIPDQTGFSARLVAANTWEVVGTGPLAAGGVDAASDAEVIAGTEAAKYVSPLTLNNNYTLSTQYASTLNGEGASLIGIEDAAGNLTATTVEGALAELGPQAPNTQAAAYTAVLADAGRMIEINNAAAQNFTIPDNATVAFPIGTIIEVCQMGAGQVTIVGAGGVTILAPDSLVSTRVQNSIISLYKRDTDEWRLQGDSA